MFNRQEDYMMSQTYRLVGIWWLEEDVTPTTHSPVKGRTI
jgi:hypothetical protein